MSQPTGSQPSPQSFRLNKFLAERLGISRREADDLIAGGRVFVNDKRAELGARVDSGSSVRLGDEEIAFENKYIYVALNKPVGYVCSKKRQGETPTVYELLPSKYRKLKTVGRLDKDSSGLILLTNDGDFAFKMTHPKFTKTKVYQVELDKSLEPLHQQMISDFGVQLMDGTSKLGLMRLEDAEFFDKTKSVGERRRFRVEMSEGRNRQIRRTFAALGYEVQKLHRIQFGKYQLGELKPGELSEIKA